MPACTRRTALVGACTALVLSAPLAGTAAAAPADGRTVYGVTSNGNRLVSFPADDPGAAQPVAQGLIAGLGPGERIVGIDVRPANGLLYALTTDATSTAQTASGTGRIYTVDTATATATRVAGSATPTLTGSFFDIDFNPVANALRIVSSSGQNLRIANGSGDLAVANTDTALAYAAGDANASRTPRVAGIAYSPVAGGATTLYDVDYSADALSRQDPPNAGTLNTVGPLMQNVTNLLGFDVEVDGTGYVSAQVIEDDGVSPGTELFTIALDTGRLTSIGSVEGDLLDSIAISLEDPPPPAEVPEFPIAALGPVAGLGIAGALLLRQRRRAV